MRYSGIQPQYFPRLHYFARVINTDIFMVRDDAQFVRKHKYPDGRIDKSYQADTPIKQAFGKQLLHVPTIHEGYKALSDTKIAKNKWVESHLKTLKIAYSRAKNFTSVNSLVKEVLNQEYHSLANLNLTTILLPVMYLLSIKIRLENLSLDKINQLLSQQNKIRLKKIMLASETIPFKKLVKFSANEKIIALCQKVGANEDYCGGTGIAAYVDHDLFKQNSIEITVQDWKCKEYKQLFNKQEKFIPNLSIIDLLMNVDANQALAILIG